SEPLSTPGLYGRPAGGPLPGVVNCLGLSENQIMIHKVLPVGPLQCNCSSIGDDDALRTGNLTANVLHTPGHTEGSVCLYFPAEKLLIAGDTLFARSIGRTDLPGGSFEKIIRSLKDRVMALPDETIVIPGHGPRTTIGEEREENPFLVS